MLCDDRAGAIPTLSPMLALFPSLASKPFRFPLALTAFVHFMPFLGVLEIKRLFFMGGERRDTLGGYCWHFYWSGVLGQVTG